MGGRFIKAWRRSGLPQVAGPGGVPTWAQAATPRLEAFGRPLMGLAKRPAVGNNQPMVTSGALLCCDCSLGGIGFLSVIPNTRAANIGDGAPMINVSSFGMCASAANPMVAAATASALGVLTPMPCIPMTTEWDDGSPNVQAGGLPALQPGSILRCAWAGLINIQASQY
jgi:hypothetical protein